MYLYTGKGPHDQHPVLTAIESPAGIRKTTPPSIGCTMEPYSLTVLQFGSAKSH